MVNGWLAGVRPFSAWIVYETIRGTQTPGFEVEMGVSTSNGNTLEQNRNASRDTPLRINLRASSQ